MSIRQRFLLTFISLVFFGVMAISTFTILFVRDHLLRSSRDNLDQQAQYLATLLAQTDTSDFQRVMSDFTRYSNYRVELLDAQFIPVRQAGATADSATATFSGVAPLAGPPSDERQYVRITASESEIRSTLRRVRYIIYAGIFFTLLVTAGVSWILADRLTLPIRELAGAARRITHGEQELLPAAERQDEIGDLSRDVAAMAQRLQDDIADLQRLNQAQEDFIAALSHEVRNPIFSARGYLEMALGDSALTGTGELDREAMLDLLRKAERNLLRIHTLFADMLMLVRLEFGQEPVELGPVSLAPVVAELEETFMPLALERGLKLVLADGNLAVVGQQELLKVTLSNLLSNALRHTEKGEVRLTVEVADGELVQLTVRDTGVGISEEHLERIFEKFYRIDKARSRDEGGTGLGLALVKQCMQSLGSTIEVTSELGVGTEFRFRLPKA
ncbi:MAG: HAMP domain-containing protein [Candidatus Marinimicrobia bacterium]|nr:HAMP domain-containing protein [Candidatus Neomarinimicrobiota bacterium]